MLLSVYIMDQRKNYFRLRSIIKEPLRTIEATRVKEVISVE